MTNGGASFNAARLSGNVDATSIGTGEKFIADKKSAASVALDLFRTEISSVELTCTTSRTEHVTFL